MSLEGEGTYSPDEIVKIFQSITVPEKTALVKIARVYAHRTTDGPHGHEDLLSEAFKRVLEGRRKWPRSVEVVPFLRNVMRSIASDWLRDPSHDEDVDVDSIGIENHSGEARIDLPKIIAMFSDDPIAQKIIMAMMEGLRGEELREISGLSKTEYESKRRKIRRRLEKFAP
jgi:RNA polymerase sigma-70 factor (ECF subfamily)